MRMVLTDHVTDDAGGLAIRVRRPQPILVHRVKDPAVHRLEAVAYVGKRAPDDDAHRVVEVRALYLFFDLDLFYVLFKWYVRHLLFPLTHRRTRLARSLG